eukprot:snap_masked-scaffold_53-processed-gene-0.8-mRNA-1 protein AED:1.00 eAED:1.00 QI:0/-1/0/0/-1/1/1/0/65
MTGGYFPLATIDTFTAVKDDSFDLERELSKFAALILPIAFMSTSYKGEFPYLDLGNNTSPEICFL